MSSLLRKTVGALLLIGAAEFAIGMMIAEALYPGYSVAQNYISDLGVGPSALIFNLSIFLLGLMVVVASYLIWRGFPEAKWIAALFFIGGVGAMGVGVFTENAGSVHGVFSAMAFVFGGISAIVAYKLEKSPLNSISVVMGVIALIALALFGTGNFLGLGKGGMERMIAYPIVLWAIAFGGYLVANPAS